MCCCHGFRSGCHLGACKAGPNLVSQVRGNPKMSLSATKATTRARGKRPKAIPDMPHWMKDIFFMGLSRPLFLYFRLFHIIHLTDKFLPMLGFKPRSLVLKATALPTVPQPLPRRTHLMISASVFKWLKLSSFFIFQLLKWSSDIIGRSLGRSCLTFDGHQSCCFNQLLVSRGKKSRKDF